MPSTVTHSSFETRADLDANHPLKSYLLHLISTKKTNLCVSADVNSTGALLRLAEDVGDHICVLKTHADIIDDFGERTIKGLKEVSRRKRFLIFEDRKFGDIGSTVQAQYTRGPLAIATWAHIVNAHMFPGPAIIPALKSAAESCVQAINRSVSTEIYVGTPHGTDDEEEDEIHLLEKGKHRSPDLEPTRKGSVVATTTIYQSFEKSAAGPRSEIRDFIAALQELGDPPSGRGLLLFAQMSSQGNLMNEEYTKKCVEAARASTDFVLGFISQRTLNETPEDNFLSFTPGVKLPPKGEEAISKEASGDGLGQQYRTPEKVITGDGCDIVIVGRGILTSKDRAAEAKRYKEEAWKAYESRIKT